MSDAFEKVPEDWAPQLRDTASELDLTESEQRVFAALFLVLYAAENKGLVHWRTLNRAAEFVVAMRPEVGPR